MKVRNGFVSNSSSSSFIVSSDTPELRAKKPIAGQVIRTQEDLDKYWTNNYGYDDDEDYQTNPDYQKCLEQLKRGKTLFGVCIDNYGSPTDYYECEIITSDSY